MKRGLLVLLAMCSLASAMVPRERKAVHTEAGPAPKKTIERCASHTPCAWTVYQIVTKVPEMTVVNTYCICEDKLECLVDEDDTATSTFVHRCRMPGSKVEKNES